MKRLSMFAFAVLLAGCSLISPSANGQLPNRVMLETDCAAGTKAGTPANQVPACVVEYIVQQTCNVATLAKQVEVFVPPSPYTAAASGITLISVQACILGGFLPPGTKAPAGV